MADGQSETKRAKPADCRTAVMAVRYHHGDLREALIDAAHRLVREKGVEFFRVADACRIAGVSTAAPYRHFRDKEELLAAVSARGFEELAARARDCVAAYAEGSIEAVVALGRGYVEFVSADPEMFHLMWGSTRAHVESDLASEPACHGFEVWLGAVDAARRRLGILNVGARDFAMPLWSQVHGLACLKLFHKLTPVEGVDLDASVERGVRAYFAGMVAASRTKPA